MPYVFQSSGSPFREPITFIDVLFALLLGLKLTVRPDLAWWIVISPELLPVVIYLTMTITGLFKKKKPNPLVARAALEFQRHHETCSQCKEATWQREMDVHSVLAACAIGRGLWAGLQEASHKAYPNG